MTPPPPSDPLRRETASGWVQGRWVQGRPSGNSAAWLGLPYARTAAGPLRFRSPEPHPGWTGVRDASRFGPDVLQPLDPSVTLTPSVEGSLLLNIWAPAGDLRGLPVLFWMHGGAFRAGSGRLYDGSHLAASGQMIVVTVNSRLGPLGYANFGGLYGDERFAHNAGFQDQVAALRWVHENIAVFGGDPRRVTIAGQSAGSVAVGLMLTNPRTRHLMSGAIMQSGALNQVGTWDNSVETAHAYANALGIRRENLNTLWTLPPQAFVSALHTMERVRARRFNSRPYLDGQWLPATVQDMLAAPSADVPLLIGANREEYSIFVRLPDRIFPRTDRTLLANLLEQWATPEQVLRVLSAYPDTQDGLTQLGTDMFFHVPNDHFARGHGRTAPTWRYRFDWRTRVFGLGATHGTELLFLWPAPMGSASSMFRGADAKSRAVLAEQMQRAWISFIQNGQPGADWKLSSQDQRNLKVFDVNDAPVEDETSATRQRIWAAIYPLMP